MHLILWGEGKVAGVEEWFQCNDFSWSIFGENIFSVQIRFFLLV